MFVGGNPTGNPILCFLSGANLETASRFPPIVRQEAGVLFVEALSQLARGTDVSLVGAFLTPEDIHVVHKSPPSLAAIFVTNPSTSLSTTQDSFLWRDATAGTGHSALCARRLVEAGGVEPPSEKRYGSKTTCLARFRLFRQPRSERARNEIG